MILYDFVGRVFEWNFTAMYLWEFVAEALVFGGASGTIFGALLEGFVVVPVHDEVEPQESVGA